MEITSRRLCNSKTSMTWRYIGIFQNPSDIKSRASNIKNLPREWWDGPGWFAYPTYCPKQNEITLRNEYEKETKMIKEVMCIATEESEEVYQLFWIYSFLESCNHKEKFSVPLKTN